MARIKYETAEAFASRKPRRDASAFRSTGSSLYSYGMHLMEHLPDGKIAVYYKPKREGGWPPSRTTSCHMKAAESILGEKLPVEPPHGAYAVYAPRFS
jgi:hypothetical protein